MIKFTIYPLQKRIDNPFPFPERRQMTLLGTGQHFTGDKRINLNKSKRGPLQRLIRSSGML